jgi:tRNA pseudouridine38-40 synthase
VSVSTVKAVLRYFGAPFAGWQVQPGLPTVQGAIEAALEQIARKHVRVHGAGRTDAGVHALGQVCSFEWQDGYDLERLRRSLCGMLSPDVSCVGIEWAPPGFHARKSAKSKRYAYTLRFARDEDPITREFVWTVSDRINLDRLAALCVRFEGERDFAGFQCSGAGETRGSVRTLYGVRLLEGGVFQPIDARHVWRIEFHGSGFLYKMVRNITGTLLDIGRGRLPESEIDQIFSSRGPYRGFTAPAHGLALLEVTY